MGLQLYISSASEKYYQNYKQKAQISRSLNVTEVDNGIILPVKVFNDYTKEEYHQGGVTDKNGHFIKESASYRGGTDFRSLKAAYPLADKPEYCDETVIYGGVLYEFYGHVLLESLSRLWYYIKNNPEHYRVVFNFVPRAQGKFKEFFELLDIPYNDRTFIAKPMQYKKVIIPEPASIYAQSWHIDWLAPFDYMSSKVKAAKYDKIYFTRTKMVERYPVWGEKKVEQMFAKNGFKVFSPERLSLRKQIALMKGCKELATVSSSTYHNLLFAQNGVKLICLNRSFEPDYCQHIVDEAKNLDASYIDASLNPLPSSHVDGPWIIGITEELKKFADDNNLKLPLFYKLNGVPSRYVVPFFNNWFPRNQNTDFSVEDVMFHQQRVKIIKEKNLKSILLRLLSKFTVGRLRKKLKMLSKGEL